MIISKIAVIYNYPVINIMHLNMCIIKIRIKYATVSCTLKEGIIKVTISYIECGYYRINDF